MSRIALGLSAFHLPVKQNLSGFVSSALWPMDLQRLSSLVNITSKAAIEGWVHTLDGDTRSHTPVVSVSDVQNSINPSSQAANSQASPSPPSSPSDGPSPLHPSTSPDCTSPTA